MKLATYQIGAGDIIGIVHDHDSKLFNLAAAAKASGVEAPEFSSMLEMIKAGDAGIAKAQALFDKLGTDEGLNNDVSAVKLRSPVPVPEQCRGFTTFPGHMAMAPWGVRSLLARLKGEEAPPRVAQPVPQINLDRPIYLKTNRFSVVGTDEIVEWPSYSKYMDVELECGFFLGKKGKNIPVEEAESYIYGYTIFGDYSARDEQVIEMQAHLGPCKGKDFDTGNAIGPFLVTRDELPDIRTRRMTAHVNGKLWADSNMSDGAFTFGEMIAYLSREETLYPGEFISAGTVSGGSGFERDIYLSDGDVIELTIDGIGTLRNKLTTER